MATAAAVLTRLSPYPDGLPAWREYQLREHCADQARRFTDAMFKLGAIDEGGAATGDMPNFRPGPHVVPDALVDTMTSEHVGKVTAFYHRAYQGDARGLLGRAGRLERRRCRRAASR